MLDNEVEECAALWAFYDAVKREVRRFNVLNEADFDHIVAVVGITEPNESECQTE